jgi:hypothetical protein
VAERPKVFCVGFQKTGTTSLGAALGLLGYRVASVVGRGWSVERLKREALSQCLATARDYDAAQDMPWPLFFRELDAAFPDAKFILTTRDSGAWFDSIEAHFGDRPDPMQAFVYGSDAAAPAGNRARYVSVYEAHNAAVRAYFALRPHDLLEMDLSRGDGWEKLAPFLGVPIPSEPFPVKNRRGDRRRLSYRLGKRLLQFAGVAPSPERLL